MRSIMSIRRKQGRAAATKSSATRVKVPFPEILPDELILHILWSLGGFKISAAFLATLICLSGVCKRMRTIITSFQPFWQYLSTSLLRKEAMDFVIKHSQPSSLHIDVSDCHGQNVAAALLPKAAREESRWKSFSLTMYRQKGWKLDTPRSLMGRYLNKRNVPELETLRIAYGEHLEEFEDLDFFGTWHMPNLRVLEVVNIVPRFVPNTESLHTFSFTFKGRREAVDFSDLQCFLAEIPKLETFSLSVVDYIFSAAPMIATLSNVTSFNLVSQNTASSYLIPLLISYEFPKLENLSIFLDANYIHLPFGNRPEDSAYRTRQINPIILSNASFLRVLTLSLTFVLTEVMFPPFFIPIERFESLRRLRLESNVALSLSVSRGLHGGSNLALRTLHLVRCPGLNLDWLQSLKMRLKGDGTWDELEEPVVEGCPLISSSGDTIISRGIVSREKSEWKRTFLAQPLLVDGCEVNSIDPSFGYDVKGIFNDLKFYFDYEGKPLLCGITHKEPKRRMTMGDFGYHHGCPSCDGFGWEDEGAYIMGKVQAMMKIAQAQEDSSESDYDSDTCSRDISDNLRLEVDVANAVIEEMRGLGIFRN